MKTAYIFMADGFEEIEAIATVDVLRRAGIDAKTVSVNPTTSVKGAHSVTVDTDLTINGIDPDDVDWMILPGGMPGASNLVADERLTRALVRHNSRGGNIAAICAAPAVVLSSLGILESRRATCYPGFDAEGCTPVAGHPQVVVDGNIVTANGPGAAVQFALKIAELACGRDVADGVAQGMLLQ